MRTYWDTPRGRRHSARDKANPYKRENARFAFERGWKDAADGELEPQRELTPVPSGNAYAKGWNARVEFEREEGRRA
jgi:hypothetical protein